MSIHLRKYRPVDGITLCQLCVTICSNSVTRHQSRLVWKPLRSIAMEADGGGGTYELDDRRLSDWNEFRSKLLLEQRKSFEDMLRVLV